MNKKLKKITAFILCILTAFTCFSVSFAADASAVLAFTVSEDGYAVVSDCDEKAQGIVTIPSNVTISGKSYQVKYIGDKAFDSCYNITEISIPEGVTAIRNFAFRDCISLKDVYIPRSLAICQYDVFEGCGDITVHCYTSNYQFFTVFGVSANIEVDIIDAAENDSTGSDDTVEESSFINTFINAIRNLILNILRYFNVDVENDDINIPFEF